jgi:hypothetical protein
MTAQNIIQLATDTGVKLWREGDSLRYNGAADAVTPLLPELAKFKLQLLELLARDDVATVAHRWRDDSTGETSATNTAAPDVAASATTGSAAAAPVIPDDVPLTATEAAAAILAGAYFSNADGNVWKIGWQQPSRSAWRYACLASGGQLIGTNRVPDMDAASAIDWAKQQQQNEVTT